MKKFLVWFALASIGFAAGAEEDRHHLTPGLGIDARDVWITRMTYHLRKSGDYESYVALRAYAERPGDSSMEYFLRNQLERSNSLQTIEGQMDYAKNLTKDLLSLVPKYGPAASKLLDPALLLTQKLSEMMLPPLAPTYGRDVFELPKNLDFSVQGLEDAYDKLQKSPAGRKYIDQTIGKRFGIKFGDLAFDPETQNLVNTYHLQDAMAAAKGDTKKVTAAVEAGVQRVNAAINAQGARVLKQLEAINENTRIARTEAERQIELRQWNKDMGEIAGAGDILAFVGSRIDPKLGQGIKTMTGASLTIINSAKMFELGQIGKIAMSANMLSAGLQIAGLFGGGGFDPVGAQLKAIIGFLEEMAKQLNRIEEKIDRIYALLVDQFKKIAYDLDHIKTVTQNTQADVRAAYTGLSLLNRDIRSYVQALSGESKNRDLRRCLEHEYVLVRDDYMDTKEFWTCLSSFATAAIDDSRSPLWSNQNLDFREGEILQRIALPVFTSQQREESFRYNLNYLNGLASSRYRVAGLPRVLPNLTVWGQGALAYARTGLAGFRKFPTYSLYSKQIREGYDEYASFFAKTIGSAAFQTALVDDYVSKSEAVGDQVRKLWQQLEDAALKRDVAAVRRPLKACAGSPDFGDLPNADGEGEASLKKMVSVNALIAEELDFAKIELCYRAREYDERFATVLVDQAQKRFERRRYAKLELRVEVQLVTNDGVRVVLNQRSLNGAGEFEVTAGAREALRRTWSNGRRGERVFVDDPKLPANAGAVSVAVPDEPRWIEAFYARSQMSLAEGETAAGRTRLNDLVRERFTFELNRAIPVWDRYRAVFSGDLQNRLQSFPSAEDLKAAARRWYETHEILRAYAEVAEQMGAGQLECERGLDAVRPEVLVRSLGELPFKGSSLGQVVSARLLGEATFGGLLPRSAHPVCLADAAALGNLRRLLAPVELLENLQHICDGRQIEGCGAEGGRRP